ncbi:hypothetical protein CVT24_000082 [Panaeolus cyanescens]|uniref:Uncharacterized protein n=1 Tax=Panaeolus cyanescens TaxID=181874 RepID=A0A409X7W7_9AGAR|nr:hypothetical protein CVT24_000082 [Panaeolus cyanescens]
MATVEVPSANSQQAINEIFEELQSKGPLKLQMLEDHKAIIRNRLIEEIDKSSTRQAVIQEVHVLAETIVCIERDFATIKHVVQRIDDKKILRKMDGSNWFFCPTWTGYHDVKNLGLTSKVDCPWSGPVRIRTLNRTRTAP